MLTRRELLAAGAVGSLAALLPIGCARPRRAADGVWVNDVHSQLNRTRVARIERPTDLAGLADAVRRARKEGRAVSIMGGAHAMGGQQFGSDTVLLASGGLSGVLEFDAAAGQVEVGAGTQWPGLVAELAALQAGAGRPWGIVQKQTGADRLSVGGALAANAHGRGLVYRPIVQDVEAFTLVDAQGEARRCSRTENADLFRLAVGGYGLFGPIASVRLRLGPRRKLLRVVEVTGTEGLSERFAGRVADGHLYGDFQYATDLGSPELLRRGVFATYRPVDPATPMPAVQRELGAEEWLDLLALAHAERGEAFARYADFYRRTDGQVYWSDDQQLSTYIDDYHRVLAPRLGARAQGTEMISEIYVPRADLVGFLEAARAEIVAHGVDLIYGTIRLIERDDETLLAWARADYACVIFNLHTRHDAASLRRTAGHFRRLIDLARARGGSYYLTYHRWATREQVLACHPALPEFLASKLQHDPEQRFQSDWYRHHLELLG
jgi:FAD/FMN-containing dehydrogenase